MHNEYFGYGNGIFLDYYNSINNSEPNYIISFDYEDVLRLGSISYFPSKILEIADLFDHLVYKYNEPNSSKVLEYIREDKHKCLSFNNKVIIDRKYNAPEIFKLLVDSKNNVIDIKNIILEEN